MNVTTPEAAAESVNPTSDGESAMTRFGEESDAAVKVGMFASDRNGAPDSSPVPICSQCGVRLVAGSYFCTRCMRYESMDYVRAWKRARKAVRKCRADESEAA